MPRKSVRVEKCDYAGALCSLGYYADFCFSYNPDGMFVAVLKRAIEKKRKVVRYQVFHFEEPTVGKFDFDATLKDEEEWQTCS